MTLISSPPCSSRPAAATAGAYRELLAARRPVAVFFNGLGDHLLTLPALRALTELFPHRLRLACLPYVREIFFADLSVESFSDVTLVTTSEGISFSPEALAASIGECDLLLFLNRAFPAPAARLMQLLLPEASIGLFPAFTHPIQFPPGIHSADLAFEIPRSLDASLILEPFLQPPKVPAQSLETATALRGLLPAGSRLLAVHTETLPDKVWPMERFQRVLDQFHARHAAFWTLVVDRKHRGLTGGRIVSGCGFSLQTAFALVARADCFLGVDSCFLHAADMFGVPGIGLFGPTSPEEFGFRFSPGIHVRSGPTMEDIPESLVLNALDALAGAGRARKI